MNLPDQNPREDAMAGDGNAQTLAVLTPPDGSSHRIVAVLDAVNRVIQIAQVDNTGAVITTNYPKYVIDLDVGPKNCTQKLSNPIPVTFASASSNIHANYIACTDADGNTYNVAKPPKLRNRITSETIDGTAIAYSYPSVVSRTATPSGGSAENQVIVPRYLDGDALYIVAPAGGSGESDAPVWLDLNVDARAWCKA